MAPDKQQAFNWSNDGQTIQHYVASLGHNELEM